jgi:DNA polymerase-3 subunit delta'
MDKKITNITYSTSPAQLWLGFHDALEQKAIQYGQKVFCSLHGCGTCITCNQILAKQHYGMIWIQPEKQYTLDDISIIHQTISYALDPGAQCFFIIQNADSLTPTCANSLLKSLEEPPHGYHFILLAERTEGVLPTIKSRCVVTSLHSTHTIKESDLYAYLTNTVPSSPSLFLSTLEESKIGERESIELLDALLLFWTQKLKESLTTNTTSQQKECEKVIQILSYAITHPPMPGSSKMLWKNLFMHIKP